MSKKKDTGDRRVDAYIRVSDIRGREGLISDDMQLENCRAWAAYKGHEIVAVHKELDVSGRSSKRPKLAAMMNRARAGETDGVVVWKASRLGRNLLDTLVLVKELDELGCAFASSVEDLDTSTRMDRFVLRLMLMLAEDESDAIGDTWQSADAAAIERGVWMGVAIPFGYTKRDDGRLEVHPVEGSIVTELFERRANGEPFSSLRRWMNTTGLRPAGKGRECRRADAWGDGHVRRLVAQRVYLGEVYRTFRGVDYRKEGTHPPLTTPVIWQVAQRRPGVSGRSKPGALLIGFARCAGCRYAMGQHEYKHIAQSYYCKHSMATKNCPAPAHVIVVGRQPGGPHGIHADKPAKVGLDDYVVTKLFEHLYTIEGDGFEANQKLEEADKELREREQALAAYSTNLEIDIRSPAGRQAFEAGFAAREAAISEARRQLEELRRSAHRPLDGQTVRQLETDWSTMTLEEQRKILAATVRHVFLRRGAKAGGYSGGSVAPRVHIVWADEPEVDVPRRGTRDSFRARPFVFPHDSHSPGDVGEAVA